MNKDQAHLYEVFSSVQGEGPYVGERHLLLRFAGCNLNCQYCDSVEARTVSAECRVEQTPGGGDFQKLKNPLSANQLLEIVERLCKNKNLHSAISITGGEPLLQIDFLLQFLPRLKEQVIYLESNGTLPKHMDEIINYVNIVAMDFKLPSATGQSSYFKEHHQFIEAVASSGTELFVKMVVSSEVKTKEIDEACGVIAGASPGLPLIIQPVNPHKIKIEQLLSFQAVAKRRLKTVRIIPQIHKILKAR
jgi:7-carboxy-7-deazaguanine synthase